LLIRAGRRAQYRSLFRFISGQIMRADDRSFRKRWEEPKLWKYRPFTRVIKGWKAYKIARDYVQLNEKEARSEVPYRKRRLKGLTITLGLDSMSHFDTQE